MNAFVRRGALLLLWPGLLLASCGEEGENPGAGVGSAASVAGSPDAGAAEGGAAASPGAGTSSGGSQGGQPQAPELCTPARSHDRIPQRLSTTVEEPRDTFDNLAAEIEVQCGNCHKSPAQQGGFSYTGTRQNLCTTRGNSGKSIAEVMLKGEMPFMIGGQEALGGRVQAWMDQGCPADTYLLPQAEQPPQRIGAFALDRSVGDALTDLGNCIPEPELLGADADADARFAAMQSFEDLPRFLSETDVLSFDSVELAKHGTIAFAPAYPLWSDDAKKLRFVHLPEGSAVEYDTKIEQFQIPANARFYKTFFRAIEEADGVTRYRKMETRLIVTRDRWQDALFGTYVWNKEETEAQLLGTGLDPAAPDKREVYLNGKPFPDYVRPYVANESTGALESYPVPGASRCVDCHQGSKSRSFVLGFTPLQINRRPKAEGGQYEPEEGDFLEDELNQAGRLIDYGLISGATVAGLPKLEDSAFPRAPRGQEELMMQAYTIGNCGHCHNPDGFAPASNPMISSFDLSPGGVLFNFNFGFTLASDGMPYFPKNKLPANSAGNALTESSWYRKTVLPTAALDPRVFGQVLTDNEAKAASFFNLHMPLHTSSVDCRLPRILARWWAANGLVVDGERAEAKLRIEARLPEDCKDNPQLGWVLEDRTERYPYVARNIDWHTKLDAWIRAEEVTEAHEALAKRVYHQGYFNPGCVFPGGGEPPADEEFWMRNPGTGEPRRAWSALYSVTPGQHIYAGICSNCHGLRGDAETGAAKAIRATSGGRVADFLDGMFGPRSSPTSNLEEFAELGPNGGAKYLVWMANGGTNVSFGRTPDEEKVFFSAFVVKQVLGRVPLPFDSRLELEQAVRDAKANMLGVAEAACDSLRTSNVSADYDAAYAAENWFGLENLVGVRMWRDVCTLNNPLTPALRASTADSEEVKLWKRRAVFNAGVMVYIYLRDGLSKGELAYPRNACNLKYPQN